MKPIVKVECITKLYVIPARIFYDKIKVGHDLS